MCKFKNIFKKMKLLTLNSSCFGGATLRRKVPPWLGRYYVWGEIIRILGT